MSSNLCFKRKGKHNTIYKYCIDKISIPKDIIIDENEILNEGNYSVVLGGMKDKIPIVAKFKPLDVYIPTRECGLSIDTQDDCKIFTTKDFNKEIDFFIKFGGLPSIPNVYFAKIVDVSDYEALRGGNPKDSQLLGRPKKIGVIIMDQFVSSIKDVKVTNQDRIRLVEAAIKNFKLIDIRDRINMKSSIYNEEIINKELKLFEAQVPICTKELSKLISSKIYKLNFETLSNLVHFQFYNIDIMKTMLCVLYSVVKDEVSYYELIKTTEVLKKKDKSDFIIFFQNFFNGKNKIFSTKYEGIKTLHEGIIGLMAANKVREVLPTFIWTYGFTPCNMPILKNNNISKIPSTLTACTRSVNYNKDDYIGIITEYIEGESLNSFVKKDKLSEEYLYSIILTILYSLKYAHEMVGFIHWDLHSDNIQMRKLDYDDYYIYLPNEKKYLWVGGHLPTIFDFGLSSMKRGKDIYGYFDFMELGISPNENYSIQNDILKFFANLYTLTRGIQDLETIFNEIYMHFTQFDNMKELNNFESVIGKNYAIFPNGTVYNINSFTNITIDDMIKFVEDMIPYYLSYLIETNRPKQVLSCNNGGCLSENKIYEELFDGTPVEDMVTGSLKDIDPKDIPNVKKILTYYLDDIFNTIPAYENIPVKESVATIFNFNSIRLTQQKMDKIEEFTTDIKGLEDVNKRVKEFKERVNTLIEKYYDVANKSISDPKNRNTFVSKIDVPEDQILKQIDLLNDLFKKSKISYQ
jgi:hypothetical protein